MHDDDGAARADRRWRTLLARSSDLAMILNDRGGLVDATPSLERFTGAVHPHDLDRRLIDFVHPDDRLAVSETFARVARGSAGESLRIDYRTTVQGGGHVWVEVVFTNYVDDPEIGGIVCNLRDIGARRAAEDALRAAAYTDTLTGLPNRSGLQSALADRSGGGALFLLDIDGFKEINDTLGHEVGDRVLLEVARRLGRSARAGDLVARLAGDEFAVVISSRDGGVDLDHMAGVLQSSFDEAVTIDGIRLRVAATMGAVSIEAGDTPGRLMRRADIALERARREHLTWRAWDDADDDSAHRLALLGDLHHAVHAREIDVVFQPKIDLATGALVGVETLARWQHRDRGTVSPAEFIPLAEQSGLIRPLTLHVLDRALQAAARWRAAGTPVAIAVNLSPTVLHDPGVVDAIARGLVRSGVPAADLMLELTESAFAGSDDATTGTLQTLHELGIGLSIDDFGTGYSVLSYLKRLPISELKIDREFVTNAVDDERDLAIAASVVDLAHRLGMTVVAEGVEDDATAALMEAIGCDIGQGFGICPPLRGDELDRWLQARAVHVTS